MLMDQEFNSPGSRPIFSFAALFSCLIVLSPDTKLNRERLREATTDKGDLNEVKKPISPTKEAPKYRFSLLLKENQRALANEYCGILDDAEQAASEIGAFDSDGSSSDSESAGSDHDEELSHIPRLLYPLTVTARVSIPTVHLYDPKDAYHAQHELPTRLCDKFLMQEIKHDGANGSEASQDVRRSYRQGGGERQTANQHVRIAMDRSEMHGSRAGCKIYRVSICLAATLMAWSSAPFVTGYTI
ncbi:uncharacterized protein EKO05_0005502 [Ascochyta rabiei]|uniref:Uncharacterized protein n=1 Tax=Didymella rabiei TaxID=5454 RepID=A0A163JUS8_DIDRA|nr:uncharacterized protein EKO05_0005502 [Ascochyta rabiei]KZM26611.1 hypothetical protein ST47_g2353 [Ascochyta rabiei]UPX15035.1 hypothetical protein EKO05_0005502 [Ascochyta rabiei]